jgi:hypothetical protein
VGTAGVHGHRAAFEEPDFRDAGHGRIRVIHERLQRFAQRMEPLGVINQLGIFQCRLLLVVQRVTLDAQLFQRFVGFVQNRAAWGLRSKLKGTSPFTRHAGAVSFVACPVLHESRPAVRSIMSSIVQTAVCG